MPVPNSINEEVLKNGITAKEIVLLEEWGRFLANGDPQHAKMTTSQIRKFFGEIKRIQADFANNSSDVVLLDPKIAYAVGRAKKDARRDQSVAIEQFYKMINPLIRKVDKDPVKFRHLVQVCEAIVAYHKANGGD